MAKQKVLCPVCGERLSLDSRFCTACGSDINTDSSVTVPVQENKPHKKKKNGFAAVLIVFLMLIIIVESFTMIILIDLIPKDREISLMESEIVQAVVGGLEKIPYVGDLLAEIKVPSPDASAPATTKNVGDYILKPRELDFSSMLG